MYLLFFDEPVWTLRSDEAYSGTAWLEIGAPVGKALAQLQVTLSLTPHCRVEAWCGIALGSFEMEGHGPLIDGLTQGLLG